MYSPPFYENIDERLRSREMKHDVPSLNTTTKDDELYTEGGEESFLSRLVDKSIIHTKRTRWYTTMVDKKKTLELLKTKLRGTGAKQICDSVLIQGRTTRWVLVWSFLGQNRLCLDASQTPGDTGAWFDVIIKEINISAVLVEAEDSSGASGGIWYLGTAMVRTWTRKWRRQAKVEGAEQKVADQEPALQFRASISSVDSSSNAPNICLYLEPGFESNKLMGLYNNLRRKLQPP